MKIIYALIFSLSFFLNFAASSDILQSKKTDVPPVLGGVVRSDKWIIKKNPPSEEFIGNVSYKNPYYEVKAGWALFKRETSDFYAKGKVEGKRNWADGAITEMFAYRAHYNRVNKFAKMFSEKNGSVKIIHFEPNYGTWQSISKEVFFDEQNKRVDLLDNVKIKGERNNARAGKISYYYETDSFKFIDAPVIWGTYKEYDFAVTGDSAESNNFFDELKVEGNTEGWIRGSIKNGT